MTDPIASPSPNPYLPGHRARVDADPSGGAPGKFWSGDDGPTFGEFIDMINPLQHIPVISAIYRAITGDEIGDGPRTLGSLIYGGPLGVLVSGVTAMFEEASGDTVLNTVAHLFDGGGAEADKAVASAENPNAAAGGQQQAAATPPAPEAPAPAATPAPDPAATPVAVASAATVAAPFASPVASPVAAASAMRSPRLHGNNQIPYNPAAALGLAQAMPMGLPAAPAATPGQAATARAETAETEESAPSGPSAPGGPAAGATPAVRFPAQRVALTFASGTQPHAFPAHPDRAAPRSGRDSPVLHPRTNPAVAQAEQTQMDRLISRWAQQQAALQKARATEPAAGPAAAPAPALPTDGAAGGLKDAVSGAVTGSRSNPAAIVPAATVAAAMAGAEGHPMLPPQNASPEWYAKAMNSALSKYQSAQGLQAGRPTDGDAAVQP